MLDPYFRMDLFAAHTNHDLFATFDPCLAPTHSESYHNNRSYHGGDNASAGEKIGLQVALHRHFFHLCVVEWPQISGPADLIDFLRFRLRNIVWDVFVICKERCGTATPYHWRG